jgi:hypothetical protein
VKSFQGWIEGMNFHPQAVHMLAQARWDRVGDISAMCKCLKKAGMQIQKTAVSSLTMSMNRLTHDRDLREWLEWLDNRFEILPEGALFFSCKNLGWDRQQLLRMALLGAMQVKGVRLIVHGVPWETADLTGQEQIVVSNGPRLSGSIVVLTECHAQGAAVLAGRFLGGNLQMRENLELLRKREGMVVTEEGVDFLSWNAAETVDKSDK